MNTQPARYYDPAVAKAVTETGQRLVRDLARRAGFCVTSTDIFTSKLEHLPITQDMEKFAEMIVRECADIANRQFEAATGLNDRGSWTAAEMKKHFGVEE